MELKTFTGDVVKTGHGGRTLTEKGKAIQDALRAGQWVVLTPDMSIASIRQHGQHIGLGVETGQAATGETVFRGRAKRERKVAAKATTTLAEAAKPVEAAKPAESVTETPAKPKPSTRKRPAAKSSGDTASK